MINVQMIRSVRRLFLFLLCSQFCLAFNAFAQEIKISGHHGMQLYRAAVEQVVKDAGFSPTFDFLPGERSLRYLSNGEVDAEFARSKVAVEFIRDKVTLVGPIGCSEGISFTRSNNPIKVSDVKDLRSNKTGIFVSEKLAVKYAKENYLNFEEVAKRESVFEMLAIGRFGLAIDSRVNGQVAIKSQKLDGKVMETGPILFAEPVFLVVHNQHKNWTARLQKAFDNAIRNGSWQAAIGEANVAFGMPKNLGLSCLRA